MHKRAPEYVVFLGQTRTEKRTYMHTVTSVECAWLSETGPAVCNVLEPSKEISPAYDPATDRVLAWCHATYGIHGWPLPLHPGAISPSEF